MRTYGECMSVRGEQDRAGDSGQADGGGRLGDERRFRIEGSATFCAALAQAPRPVDGGGLLCRVALRGQVRGVLAEVVALDDPAQQPKRAHDRRLSAKLAAGRVMICGAPSIAAGGASVSRRSA